MAGQVEDKNKKDLTYVMTVLQHTELPQPNYHEVAAKTGATNANVAQKRFKAIVEAAGFKLVNKQIVLPGSEDDAQTTPASKSTPAKKPTGASKKTSAGPKSNTKPTKKRKLEVAGDGDAEDGTASSSGIDEVKAEKKEDNEEM